MRHIRQVRSALPLASARLSNSDKVKDTSLKAESKAKDSTLNAKAKTKDFKIVLEDPRGRGFVVEDSNTA